MARPAGREKYGVNQGDPMSFDIHLFDKLNPESGNTEELLREYFVSTVMRFSTTSSHRPRA
jgi:hypothetical protein